MRNGDQASRLTSCRYQLSFRGRARNAGGDLGSITSDPLEDYAFVGQAHDAKAGHILVTNTSSGGDKHSEVKSGIHKFRPRLGGQEKKMPILRIARGSNFLLHFRSADPQK